MATIPHRGLRNQSSKILERVNGETISVANNGELAATLIPPSCAPVEQLLRSGSIRPAIPGKVDFRLLPRVKVEESTADMLADLRGDR
ncbi:prevent-host-death protein antitoxin of TAS system [Arthrobacter sp. Br18]|uniref:type II toxin-antitoxin system Phd/YefM family antitoxin n=1 Tax=Arthrobacter sp. Br18 TaxID=1312954 RepID=UPI00047CAFEF|nr:prevent-host-death protein antitoxin of TAS system [Arthrobacter sp. Br18]